MEQAVVFPVAEKVAAKRVEINAETPEVLICVYGTLRKGEGNHRLLEGKAERLGTFKSDPNFTMWGRRAGYPVLSKGDSSIVFEVYKIKDAKVLENLHNLESCTGIPGDEDNWYDIMPMKVPTGPEGAWQDAWIYIQHDFKSDILHVIPSGNWKNKSA